jgi:hypothetical protein
MTEQNQRDLAARVRAARVRAATGAHRQLERLVQQYYSTPDQRTAKDILTAAQELYDCWQFNRKADLTADGDDHAARQGHEREAAGVEPCPNWLHPGKLANGLQCKLPKGHAGGCAF